MTRVITRSAQETRALGKAVGSALDAPLTFILSGDSGSGKTVFVQGLAEGLGIPGETEVASPSFALIHEHSGRLFLFHVDLYRLEKESEMEDLGLEEILDGRAVAAVEWGERLPEGYLTDYVTVCFEILSDTERRIEMAAYGAGSETVLKTVNSDE
ncbi:MAG: tRNA (adenosine(37)-N6)-threonylcarbamoyltransferase complex ATPase subunit type 1 TsaE [Deltaproteobacteria bacterium]|nr:tRNA (adenosine(37)-N6)-threonylcarbamoyltransferase complex ATPase subunit type 1 TsaE [Deltaproteobacteria bacterium]